MTSKPITWYLWNATQLDILWAEILQNSPVLIHWQWWFGSVLFKAYLFRILHLASLVTWYHGKKSRTFSEMSYLLWWMQLPSLANFHQLHLKPFTQNDVSTTEVKQRFHRLHSHLSGDGNGWCWSMSSPTFFGESHRSTGVSRWWRWWYFFHFHVL